MLKSYNSEKDSSLVSSLVELLYADAPIQHLYTLIRELGKTSEFKIMKQCDAHELLLYLIDSLFTELKEFKNPFEGKMLSTITCTRCQNRSETNYPYTTLSLQIPDIHLAVSVEELIEEFCKEEILDTPIECDKCKLKMQSCKQLGIEPGSVVVVHLKRFQGNSKINTQIEMTPEIDIMDKRYRLYAICNHSGNTFGGHYTAACMKRDGSWSLCNDKEVNPISTLPDKSDRPYVLFYCKI
jgi:ubiquitin C-terminal hydrolase